MNTISSTERFLRTVGFCTLTGIAMAILAALVLTPRYARLERTRHQLACEELRLQESKAACDAMQRLLQNAQTDEVLNKRWAWSKLGMMPRNEGVVFDLSAPLPPPPGTIAEIHYPDPPPPSGWAIEWADRLDNPRRARSLLLLAGAMTICAVIFFAPPSWQAIGYRIRRLPPPPVTKKD